MSIAPSVSSTPPAPSSARGGAAFCGGAHRTARFDSRCPQCKTPLAIGMEIAQCSHDRVWRCLRCTAMFEELGSTKPAYYLTAEDAEKDKRRREEIVERYRRELAQ